MSVEIFIDNALAYTLQRIFPKTLSIYNETGIRKADGSNAVVTQPMKEVVCVPVRPFDYYIIEEVGIDIPIAFVRIIEPYKSVLIVLQFTSHHCTTVADCSVGVPEGNSMDVWCKGSKLFVKSVTS